MWVPYIYTTALANGFYVQSSTIISRSNIARHSIQRWQKSGFAKKIFYAQKSPNISRPHRRAMRCLLWGFARKMANIKAMYCNLQSYRTFLSTERRNNSCEPSVSIDAADPRWFIIHDSAWDSWIRNKKIKHYQNMLLRIMTACRSLSKYMLNLASWYLEITDKTKYLN